MATLFNSHIEKAAHCEIVYTYNFHSLLIISVDLGSSSNMCVLAALAIHSNTNAM